MPNNTLVPGAGSTDWAGGRAPAGGSRTGTSTLTMLDGTRFQVAHSYVEVLTRLDRHAIATSIPRWVSFDVPASAVPIIVNVDQVTTIT